LQPTVEMLQCNKQTTYQTISLTVSQTTITNTNTHTICKWSFRFHYIMKL